MDRLGVTKSFGHDKRLYENINRNKYVSEKNIPKLYREPIETMLHLPCEINGTTIDALIDTGCNKSIISYDAAKRCNITSIIDKKQQKKMYVVGSVNLIGNIHIMIGKIGNMKLPFSLLVSDDLCTDFLLGCDIMKFHNFILDFAGEAIRICSIHAIDNHFKKIIEKQIAEGDVCKNKEFSQQYIPKRFRKPVNMLNITCVINGVSLNGILDSGCNSSVMSLETAKLCGLKMIIDEKEKSIAEGCGKGDTVVCGLIHFVLIEIGNVALPCSIAVVDQMPTELLLGLDFLIHHRVTVDLKYGSLQIGPDGPILESCERFIR